MRRIEFDIWPPLLPRSDAVYGNAEPFQVRSVMFLESLIPDGVGYICDMSSQSGKMKFGDGDLLVLLL